MILVMFLPLRAFCMEISISPFSPYLSNGFPPVIGTGNEATAEFVVSNNLQQTLHIKDASNLPLHSMVLLTGPGYCGKQATLNPLGQAGSSCIIGLKILPQNNPIDLKAFVREYVTETGNTFNYPWPINVKIITGAIPNMATISIEPAMIALIPGVDEFIIINNDSPSQVANDVRFTSIPAELNDQIANITYKGCAYINPNDFCAIKITAKPDAVSISGVVSIKGSNTNQLDVDMAIQGEATRQGLIASEVSFPSPGQQNLNIINPTNTTANIQNITFVPGGPGVIDLHNVTVGDWSGCNPLAGNDGSCNVTLIAANNAYGRGVVKIDYTLQGIVTPQTANTTATVDRTKIAIPFMQEDGIYVEPGQNTTVTVQNLGNFILQPLTTAFLKTYAGIDVVDNYCANNTTPIGGSCIFKLRAGPYVGTGATALLELSGDNIVDTDTNVLVPGFGVFPVVDPNNTHLSYKAIKINNATGDNATIGNIAISANLTDKVKFCPVGDTSTCEPPYQSTCDALGNNTIPNNQSRIIWLRALQNENIDLGFTNGTVNITATSNGTQKLSFPVKYSQDLYAGGLFSTAGNGTDFNIDVNHIAKWNGSVWSPLDTGIQHEFNLHVNALSIYKGDLYVAGIFDSAGGVGNTTNIARWNGNNWLGLPGTTFPFWVRGLGVDNALDVLYISNGFVTFAWNSTALVPLVPPLIPPPGLTAFSMDSDLNLFYAVGVGGSIWHFDGSTITWVSDTSPVISNLVALAYDTTNQKMYVGTDDGIVLGRDPGNFWVVLTPPFAHPSDILSFAYTPQTDRIYTGTSDGLWEFNPNGATFYNISLQGSEINYLYALAPWIWSLKDIYVGGLFSDITSNCNNIAKINLDGNTTLSSNLGTGVNDKVESLLIAPSISFNY